MPTSSCEPIRPPTRRRPIPNNTGASNGPKSEQLRLFSPHLFIYFEQTLPLVRFDTPTYVTPRVSFPSHYGPPSVMIHADPAFSHLFRLNLKIHKITQSSSLPPSSIFPNSPFYLITITIVPRLLTDLTHPEISRPTTNSPVTTNLTPPTVRPRRQQ
jgi:hypothetical protein